MADVGIVIVIGAALVGIIWKKVKDAKAGKSGCGCSGCSGCSGCREAGGCRGK